MKKISILLTLLVVFAFVVEVNAASTYTLTTSKAGAGTGFVSWELQGFQNVYEAGTNAVIMAIPDSATSKFAGWNDSDICSGRSTICILPMNQNHTAKANFDLLNPGDNTNPDVNNQKTVTIGTENYGGSGSGTVTGGGTYPKNSSVTLTAIPNQGSQFFKWSGDRCENKGATCTFNITGNTREVAVFLPSSTLLNYTLTILNKGNGYITGTQSSTYDWGTTVRYNSGTSITLTANPRSDSDFDKWNDNGPCAGKPATCTFTLRENSLVQAEYKLKTTSGGGTNPGAGTFNLVVTKAGAGAAYGEVTHLGTTSHNAGTYVTVTASITNSDLVKFAGWNDSDICSGRSLTCTLPMTKNQSAKANFDFINPNQTSLLPTSSNLLSDSSNYSPLDLEVGMARDGVITLQKYLNSHGYVVNTNQGEDGSVGHETNYFGEKTKQALIKFQKDKGITPAQGFFGPQTRRAMGI